MRDADWLDYLPSPAWVVQAEGRILQQNMLTSAWPKQVLETAEIQGYIARCLAEQRVVRAHEVLLGATALRLLTIAPMPENCALLLAEMHDTQGDLQPTSALRTAGALAAMLAHEVKNPLSSIRGAAQLLAQDNQNAEQNSLYELMLHEVDRARDVIDQFEFFASPVALTLEQCNIHESLRYVAQLLQNGLAPNVRVEEQYDPSLPPVLARKEWCVQAMLNLVKNAAESLVEAGTPSPRILLTSRYRRGPMPVCVTVEDNGPGISPFARERLFEPVESGKQGGRGLGLPIVKKIMQDFGGSADYTESALGGACFRLWFVASVD